MHLKLYYLLQGNNSKLGYKGKTTNLVNKYLNDTIIRSVTRVIKPRNFSVARSLWFVAFLLFQI